MRVPALSLLFVFALARGNEYLPSTEGMQGLKIFCDTQAKLDFLLQYKDHPDFNLAKIFQDRQKPVQVFVAAKEVQQFKYNLDLHDIDYEIFVEDFSKLLEQQYLIPAQTRTRRTDRSILLDHFPRYTEILHYVKYLASAHNDIAKYFSIGKSSEGLEIVGVKITSGGDDNKPALFIDAGIHAREWIAPTTALYIIQQLVENSTNRYIFENLDIYVIPSLNPDGYTYSQLSNETRLWRKTRSKNPDSTCIGVDGNRNYEYQWMTIGASANPCSDIYAGNHSFSEPETMAMRDFIMENNSSTPLYVSLHSYGNYILHPWAYKKDVPRNEPLLRCVAKDATEEIEKIRGTKFEIGSSTNLLSSGAGSSDDWSLALGGMQLAYTIELGHEQFGFATPTSEIEPVGQEFLEFVKALARYAEGKICQEHKHLLSGVNDSENVLNSVL